MKMSLNPLVFKIDVAFLNMDKVNPAVNIAKMQACTQTRVLRVSVIYDGVFRIDAGVVEWTNGGSEIKLRLRIDQLTPAVEYFAAPGCWGEDFIEFVYLVCVDTVPTVEVTSICNGVELKYNNGVRSFTFTFNSRITDRSIVINPPVRSALRVSSVDSLITSVSVLLEELRR